MAVCTGIEVLRDESFELLAGDLFSLESYGHTGFTGTSLWIDPKRELVVACFTSRVYPGRDKPGIDAFRRAVHDITVGGISA